MPEAVVIVGCGGHGREVLGIVRAIGRWTVAGFVDDAPTEENLERLARLGAPYLGPSTELGRLPPATRLVIGIGDPRVRATVAAKVEESHSLRAVRLIHPAATVGLDTTIGEGCVIFAGARVTTNVTLGRHVHLNQNTTVGHDSSLGDCVAVHPLASVSGDCRIGDRALIGTNATVLQGLQVGADATVGAGACVVRSVIAGAVVKGVPAR